MAHNKYNSDRRLKIKNSHAKSYINCVSLCTAHTRELLIFVKYISLIGNSFL